MYVGVAGVFTLRTPAQTIAWLAGSVGAQVTIGLLDHVSGGELGSIAFTSFMSGLLVYVVKQMNLLIDQLRATQAELAQAAVAEERLRFSRDLHDLLGHTLSLVVVKAEVVRRLIARDPVTAEREAGDIETIGRRALVEVREAVTGYRDRSFAAELDGARSALADAGIAVTVRETGDPLPAVADDVFGWAVREGVTNVIRHSQAQNCEIEVRREACRATLEIRDDGVGAVAGADAVAPDGHDGRSGLSYRLGSGAGRSAVGGLGAGGLRPGGPGAGHRAAGSGPGGREAGHRPLTGLGRGHGLRGLSERVHASGGTLIATPVPAGGFRLTASIPVPALVDPRLPASPERSGSGVKDSISG
jgi:two-component system sensor histidine kinase DesK